MKKLLNRVIKQDFIKWEELNWIQGELKELSEKNFKKLLNSVIENGIVKAFHVWENKGDIYCLDGNHLKKVIEHIKENNLYEIPEKLKADFIECKDMKEAQKMVLVYSAEYAKITEEGLYDYLHQTGLNEDFAELEGYLNFSNINLEQFEKGYLDDDYQIEEIPEVEIQGETEEKAEYLIINFNDVEEYEKVKAKLNLGKTIRAVDYSAFKEVFQINDE